MLFSLNLEGHYLMSSTANTSLRKAMDELGQALEFSFGDKHQCKEAIAQIKETIKSIETRLEITSVVVTERLNALANDENFEPQALDTDNLESASVKPLHAVAEVIRS